MSEFPNFKKWLAAALFAGRISRDAVQVARDLWDQYEDERRRETWRCAECESEQVTEAIFCEVCGADKPIRGAPAEPGEREGET